MVRIVDESGEDYLYSADYFLPLAVPAAVGGALQSSSDEIGRISVQSSTVASVGYDPTHQILDVEFRRTREVYRYYRVPALEYRELMNASSLGAYLNQQFKRANYRFERIYPEKRGPRSTPPPQFKTKIRSPKRRKATVNL